MDFQMPDDVVEFREQIHDFIRRHRTPELEAEIAGHHLHGYGPAAETFLQALADEGLPSIAWPEEYGGRGKGALYLWILSEELAREGMPWDTLTFNSVSPTIMRHGSEEQRRAAAEGPDRRGPLRPRLHRAERRHGPRLAADPRRPRRRRVGA